MDRHDIKNRVSEELLAIADELADVSLKATAPEVWAPLDRLQEAANQIGKSWSGSSLGYHACVYYEGLKPPPPGHHFNQQFGLRTTAAGWTEYSPDDVKTAIYRLAENPDLSQTRKLACMAETLFEKRKPDVLSILSTCLAEQADTFLHSLKDQVEALTIPSGSEVLKSLIGSGMVLSNDMLAISQGARTPPHIKITSELIVLSQQSAVCSCLGELSRRAGSHLARQARRSKSFSREIGTNVFIGHGHSPVWRQFKDFIQDRRHLPWDEFDRVPIAGIANTARLSEMLDSAAVAFLIMTGEDEQVDGKRHARMNVIHEAGLFQGRLGFTKAFILLEEGCEEFSNIAGLGQIRFPHGNIKASFDDVRRVLEREGLIKAIS